MPSLHAHSCGGDGEADGGGDGEADGGGDGEAEGGGGEGGGGVGEADGGGGDGDGGGDGGRMMSHSSSPMRTHELPLCSQ